MSGYIIHPSLLKTATSCILITVGDLGLIVAVILAVVCVTRTLVQEEITRPLRLAVIDGFTLKLTKKHELHWTGSGDKGKLTYLIHCIYCTGFWVAATLGTIAAIWHTNHAIRACYFILALAEAGPRALSLLNKWTGDR